MNKNEQFESEDFLKIMVGFVKSASWILDADFDGFISYAKAAESPIPGQKEEVLKLAQLFVAVKDQMQRISVQSAGFMKSIEKAGQN